MDKRVDITYNVVMTYFFSVYFYIEVFIIEIIIYRKFSESGRVIVG